MPKKAVDEDRARRKAALEQKRAARKLEKQQHEQQQRMASAQNNAPLPNAKQRQEQLTSNTANNTFGLCWLLDIPQEKWQRILCFLESKDLGCLVLTCTHFLTLLHHTRVGYLTAMVPHLAVTEEACASILEECTGGGDTGRQIPKSKRLQAVSDQNLFVPYSQFVWETQGRVTLSIGQPRTKLPKFVNGRFVSVSCEHTLSRNGGVRPGSGVASWGIGRRGQLGHNDRLDIQFPKRLLNFGYNIQIVQVSAGGGLVRVSHSLLLTSTGRVLSFGTGQYGALGHGFSAAKQLPDYLQPAYIQGLSDIVCVSAGELHSAAVSADGDVYTWGDSFCGQCGHGDKRPQLEPKQVETGNLQDEVVVNISCGSRHTLAVTEDGECFSFGLGHFGVLGRSFTPFEYDADAAMVGLQFDEDEPLADRLARMEAMRAAQQQEQPPPAAAPPRDEAAELAAHLDLIANLTLDDASDQCIARRIDSLSTIRVVHVSAGHRHSLILDEHGQVYSCGSGLSGCLGHGDTRSQMFPTLIEGLRGVHVNQLSGGVDMSMAVCRSGCVYAWGKTDKGRIGLGPKSMAVTQPRRVMFENPNFKAVDVECGYVHSIIVGLNGTFQQCGAVGVNGESDGLETTGRPQPVLDFNIWHQSAAPKTQAVKKERWVKYGKYEVKGRSKMMSGDE